jgi:hypothetical protein
MSLVNYALKVLMDLIAIRTIAPPGENYTEAVDYMENELTNLGLSVKVIEVPRAKVREYYPEWSDYRLSGDGGFPPSPSRRSPRAPSPQWLPNGHPRFPALRFSETQGYN